MKMSAVRWIVLAEWVVTYNAISSIGFVIGPGNLMATTGGFKFAVTTTAFVFLINFIVSWWLVHPDQHTNKDHTNTDSDDTFSFKGSIAFMRSETWPKVSGLMLERFIISVSVLMLRSNFSLFLEHKYNAGLKIIGYIVSFSGVIVFGSAMITGFVTRMYGNESRLMFHSSLLMLASQIGLNFATHISFIFVLLIPFGFASSVMRVVVAHLLLQRVSPREKGEVIGMGQSSIALARIVSLQLAGLAMEHSTELPGTIGIAFAALASGLIYKRTVYRVEQKKD
ncbi:uncharacterized protein LOC134187076 [Corticium candelabrum]|uniref:uncharacterized protein LOC134187076 n=1 Tax=Corticium candelabrum TaxID=121492 RepID=UPI002E26CBC9|nr:uncharacterized protein LOC134187076 [Corticium candelabrum]XP_062511179.1 uncharacterized protein LOC134187076 [Corticium candelabrum]